MSQLESNPSSIPCVSSLPISSPFPGRSLPPPEPVSVQDYLEWEVLKILDSRRRRNRIQYLVEWTGYLDDADRTTWEPASNLTNLDLISLSIASLRSSFILFALSCDVFGTNFNNLAKAFAVLVPIDTIQFFTSSLILPRSSLLSSSSELQLTGRLTEPSRTNPPDKSARFDSILQTPSTSSLISVSDRMINLNFLLGPVELVGTPSSSWSSWAILPSSSIVSAYSLILASR
ncbi:hypothetical protein Pst134EA_005266 [Puccinia striiformis f. sp. tritici]|uniref:hypothetical protein n=1 Tax=Puccinia striiformis f. sp. tritici TaxID=168172 RepID=UPI002007AAF4|nr:hypothetical protein Pst134EA_005266 [Puccinia striiformis f. sp. tritici]KAH9471365.1 hypothetical protein Pst134EA_005266 [Puccinia striiformis f. sp. tritici]